MSCGSKDSKMHLLSCINTHCEVTDLVNHGMIKNTKTWTSWERNIIFLWSKKTLNLCFRWLILRSYCFVAEITFKSSSFVECFLQIEQFLQVECFFIGWGLLIVWMCVFWLNVFENLILSIHLWLHLRYSFCWTHFQVELISQPWILQHLNNHTNSLFS